MAQETLALTVEQVSRESVMVRDPNRKDLTPFDYVKPHPASGRDIWQWVLARRKEILGETPESGDTAEQGKEGIPVPASKDKEKRRFLGDGTSVDNATFASAVAKSNGNVVATGRRVTLLGPTGPNSPRWHTFDPIAEGSARRAGQQTGRQSSTPRRTRPTVTSTKPL